MSKILAAREDLSENSSGASASVQNDGAKGEQKKGANLGVGKLRDQINDETYLQINSVSFSDDFKILVKHYKF